MFRAAAPGPYDEAVAKATDENATSEDWAAILEVCDRVNADTTNGPKEAVASLIKRLAHRNANVQLYALELANALSQNCGIALHRELASRAFTEALLKLANDRNTHQVVRVKILERMQEWSEQFASNTDLGIMQDACGRLQQSQPRLQQQAPPPSAPQKDLLTEQDRQREEDDLQRALKLSLEEEASRRGSGGGGANIPDAANPSGLPAGAAGFGAAGAAGTAAAPASTTQPQPATAATVSRVRALFDFTASEADELTFKKGDVIAVLESVYRDWWRGSLRGQTGIFPLNYVEILADPTPEELEREAQMEAQVFAEIKNVEKLLTLLSASNTGPREEDSDEISKLYHQTLAIRPNLIRLIEKYSQKKDDFTQLNEKFIKARRDYEALLESSMSHPPQPNYQQYAMRPQLPPQASYPNPGAPGGAAAGPAPYHVLSSQPQPDQRYYTPGPQRQDSQPYAQSPPPNFHRHSVGAAPAPFYLVNDPVSSTPPPQQQHQQHQQRQRLPSGGGLGGPGGPNNGRPSPLQTNGANTDGAPPVAGQPLSAPPQSSSNNQAYVPYNPTAMAPHHHAPSYYGNSSNNPQELSTSAYDNSPVAAPYDPKQQQQPDVPRPLSVATNNGYAPASSGYGLPASQPQQQQQPPPQPYSQPPPTSPLTTATTKFPDNAAHYAPQETAHPGGYAWSGQHQQQPGGPSVSSASLPLSPPSPAPSAQQPPASYGGGAPPVPASYYDARHTLPSQRPQQRMPSGGGGGGSSPPLPSAPPLADQQQQYQAYAPPAAEHQPPQHQQQPVTAAADDYYRY